MIVIDGTGLTSLTARGRIVDELPLRMAVVDRRAALIALPDPVARARGYPTNLLLEHAGAAVALSATFEHYWMEGRSYS